MNLSGIASQFATQNRSTATQKSQWHAENCNTYMYRLSMLFVAYATVEILHSKKKSKK